MNNQHIKSDPEIRSGMPLFLDALAIFAMPLPVYADNVLDEFVGLNFLMLCAVLAVFLVSLALRAAPE